MPIYEYICTACDHRADILHGINDPAPAFCLSCGQGGTMRKLFAAPAVHFKGSGWAKKDRGSGSSRTKAAAAGESKPDTSSSEKSGTSAGAGSTDAPPAGPSAD